MDITPAGKTRETAKATLTECLGRLPEHAPFARAHVTRASCLQASIFRA
jgi:hypothetical protein